MAKLAYLARLMQFPRVVIPHRGSRIRMGGGLLDVAQRHPGIKRDGNKCLPKGVRGDGFGDPGAASDLADEPPRAVPVQPPSVGGQEHRPVGAPADGQVDGPGSARRQRDRDDLAALAGDGQRPVSAL